MMNEAAWVFLGTTVMFVGLFLYMYHYYQLAERKIRRFELTMASISYQLGFMGFRVRMRENPATELASHSVVIEQAPKAQEGDHSGK